MKASIKTKWLEALRSGKYKQARNSFRNNDKFCCLAVLADVHRKTTKKAGNKWNDDNYVCNGKKITTGILSDELAKWAGLKSREAHFETEGINYKGNDKSLVDCNDNSRKSFKQIANIIEKYF